MRLLCFLLGHKWLQIGPETCVCDRCGHFVEDARVDL